jgi:hypothetical protein
LLQLGEAIIFSKAQIATLHVKEKGRNKKDKSPETNPNEMKLYHLPDLEFKITIIMQFNEVRDSVWTK